jgi:hypothetical protein
VGFDGFKELERLYTEEGTVSSKRRPQVVRRQLSGLMSQVSLGRSVWVLRG